MGQSKPTNQRLGRLRLSSACLTYLSSLEERNSTPEIRWTFSWLSQLWLPIKQLARAEEPRVQPRTHSCCRETKARLLIRCYGKECIKGIQVYKKTKLADKVAISAAHVRGNIEYMIERGEHLNVDGASIILAELCGVLLGLRRSEHFATAVRSPNLTTLLCCRNLKGAS